MKYLLVGALCAIGVSFSAQAAVVNGDFSSDLNGWSTSTTLFGIGDVAPSSFVTSQGTTDTYAQLKAGPTVSNSQVAVLYSTLSQSIEITADMNILRFDLALLQQTADQSGTSRFNDNLIAGFVEDGVWRRILNLRFDTGLELDRFNGTNDFTGPKSEIAAVNADFDYGVEVDLSALVGKTIGLEFRVGPVAEGLTSDFGVDNVRLTAATTMTPVPLPAGLPLLVGALGFLAVQRRKA